MSARLASRSLTLIRRSYFGLIYTFMNVSFSIVGVETKLCKRRTKVDRRKDGVLTSGMIENILQNLHIDPNKNVLPTSCPKAMFYG